MKSFAELTKRNRPAAEQQAYVDVSFTYFILPAMYVYMAANPIPDSDVQ